VPTERDLFEQILCSMQAMETGPCLCGDPPDPECQRCGGTGTFEPDVFDAPVIAYTLTAWIRAMALTRADQNYARFDEQWTVLEEYVTNLQALSLEIADPDEMRELVGRAMGVPAPAAPVETGEAAPGALSPEELLKFGIET